MHPQTDATDQQDEEELLGRADGQLNRPADVTSTHPHARIRSVKGGEHCERGQVTYSEDTA